MMLIMILLLKFYFNLFAFISIVLKPLLKFLLSGFYYCIYRFYNNKNAYLKNSWNILDFSIVSMAVLDKISDF